MTEAELDAAAEIALTALKAGKKVTITWPGGSMTLVEKP